MAWLVFLGDFSILPFFKSGSAGTDGAAPFASAFQYPASGLGSKHPVNSHGAITGVMPGRIQSA
ncbi:TPA: hypothetical protein JDD34_002420 [Salmonella enterica subsp. diarizonae]|nr:hypothetical protein [Salmonella enterica subsp. diarizonae]